MNASAPAGLAEVTGPTPVRLREQDAGRRVLGGLEPLQWGPPPERRPEELGLAARWALRAALSGGHLGSRTMVVARAAELTQRALEWHSAAARGTRPVGPATLAGDYCLAQAAGLLARCGSSELEGAFADALTAAGSVLASGGETEVAVRQLLPAAGWGAARCSRLSGSRQAGWWRAGRRLAGGAPGEGPSGPTSPDARSLLSSADPLERRLGQTLALDPGPVSAPMARLLGAGGKRIRAHLLLLAGESGDRYRPDLMLQGAAAMEILHAATLCHDDLVDGADSRRGAPTVAATQGPLAALGVGDYFLGRASGMVARLRDPRISRAFARALVEIADGQLRELRRRSVWSPALGPYVQVARRKTGSLLSACAAIGALLGGAGASDVRALSRFARDLGLAFQGIDDCLDFSDPGRTGKPAGIDLAQGVCGLPVLCSLRGPRGGEVLQRLRRMERSGPGESARLRAEVVALVHESGALATARTVADGWSGEALAHVAHLSPGLRAKLERFADRLTLRDR